MITKQEQKKQVLYTIEKDKGESQSFNLKDTAILWDNRK